MSSIFSQHIFPFIMELNTEFFMCVCLLSLWLCRLRLWFSPSKNVWIQKWGNGRAFGQNQKVAWKEKSTVARKTSELLIFTTQYHRNNLTNIFWMFTLRQGIQTHTADCPPEVFSPWGHEMRTSRCMLGRIMGEASPEGLGAPRSDNQTQVEDGGGREGL